MIRTCPGKPNKPVGEYTQRDVAVFITELDAAHTSCKANLAAVDKTLKAYENTRT